MNDIAQMMTRYEAAQFLRIGLRTLDEHVKHRRIPSMKIGRRRLFHHDHLRRWFDAQHKKARAI